VFYLRQELKFKYLNELHVFTLILFLSEGRVGIAWEPSNNNMLFLHPEIKCVSLLFGFVLQWIKNNSFFNSVGLYTVVYSKPALDMSRA
jgi:hypothetical protein